MKTEDLFQTALKGPGLLGFMAKHFIDADQKTKKEFLLNLKEQIPEVKQEMIQYYGSEFVMELERFE